MLGDLSQVVGGERACVSVLGITHRVASAETCTWFADQLLARRLRAASVRIRCIASVSWAE
jgi:hypothetical protein